MASVVRAAVLTAHSSPLANAHGKFRQSGPCGLAFLRTPRSSIMAGAHRTSRSYILASLQGLPLTCGWSPTIRQEPMKGHSGTVADRVWKVGAIFKPASKCPGTASGRPDRGHLETSAPTVAL